MDKKKRDNATGQEAALSEQKTTEDAISTEAVVEISVEDQLKQELGIEKDKFLRLFADFENYKKRVVKERIELIKTAGQEILQSLLPVLDDFDRALAALSQTENEKLLTGISLIHHKLKEILKSKGLEEIPVMAGDVFDAECHEAITQIPAPEEALKGKIIDTAEKGYKLGEKIIRYPKVIIGQ